MPASSKASTPRLKKRAEFLHASSKGVRTTMPGFVLQAVKSKESSAPRYGLTATKKLGNAVERNRARRRLRALAEKILPKHAVPGDYVLVAREGVFSLSFAALEDDLHTALKKIACLKA